MTWLNLMILRGLHKQIKHFAETELDKRNYDCHIKIRVIHKFHKVHPGNNPNFINYQCETCKHFECLSTELYNSQMHPKVDHKNYCKTLICSVKNAEILITCGSKTLNCIPLADPAYEIKFQNIIQKFINHDWS